MIELLVGHLLMEVGDEDSSGATDLDIDECLSFDYQPREGVPGFEIETKEAKRNCFGPQFHIEPENVRRPHMVSVFSPLL